MTEIKRVRFGIFLPQFFPWEQLSQWAQRAEALGFESVWVADHFVNPYFPQVDWLDGWSLLAALAAKTSKIRLGPLVTHVVYHNPAVLARQTMTVDRISNGRLNLGIGAGGSRHCHTMTGVDVWQKGERYGRFHEAITLIDQLLRQETTSFEGKYYRVEEAIMNPRPVQQPRPPLTIAAHGPKTLKLAAEIGDAWSLYYPGVNLTTAEEVASTRQRSDQVSEYALAAGRDPDKIVRSLAVGYSSERPFASLEAFYDFVGRYHEAGINEFILGYAPGADERPDVKDKWIGNDELLERIAHEAIPKLMT